MTPMIPAVLLWRDAPTEPPVQCPTDAPAHMCSDVAVLVIILAAALDAWRLGWLQAFWLVYR